MFIQLAYISSCFMLTQSSKSFSVYDISSNNYETIYLIKPSLEETFSVKKRQTAILNSIKQVFTRCYEEYGCFTIGPPFLSLARPINLFPFAAKDIMPQLCLYTQGNSDKCQELSVDDFRGIRNINRNSTVKVVTHGYLEHGGMKWIKNIVKEFMNHRDLNVIVIDWAVGSGPPYTQACANIRLIGAILAKFILCLEDEGFLLRNIHLIGHSLGAHLAGYVGEHIKKVGKIMGRITGLDPAEPYFEGTEAEVRLDSSDAEFVDVIHTDSGPIILGGLGMHQQSGDLDFYPNGGIHMPGCMSGVVDAVMMENGSIPFGIRRFLGCNHIRSYEYFAESINSQCPFLAVECSSWEAFMSGSCLSCGQNGELCSRMGEHASLPSISKTVSGEAGRSLYLVTGDEKPFCRFHYRVILVMSYTEVAKRHGGELGIFYIYLFGENGLEYRARINQREFFFEPGYSYSFIIGASELGTLKHAVVEWHYVMSFHSPVVWRILSRPSVFLNRIYVDSLELQIRHEFCAFDTILHSGTKRELQWHPRCPDQTRLRGTSILGTILNFDTNSAINNNMMSLGRGFTKLGNGQLFNEMALSPMMEFMQFMAQRRGRRKRKMN